MLQSPARLYLPHREHAKERLGFGGGLPVALGQQPIAGLNQQLTTGLLTVHSGLPQPQQQPRPLGIPGRPQLQGRRIPASGGREGVQPQGPVASLSQGQPGRRGQPGSVLAGGPAN